MAGDALSVRDLQKSFGKNHVLRGIDLSLTPGSVTVLMGANGAGKSTLVKVICGHHPADGGTMTLAGDRFTPHDAADAIRKGVVTVHQSIDDGVIPDLDVANNLMLDRLVERGHGLFVRETQLREEAAKVAAAMGIDVNLKARVSDLAVADRQMIAIARAMARAPKVLILDEPTSSLSATEADRLFALIDRLRDQGVAILYISHRMSDIRRLADRIVVMRDGAISGLFETAPLDYEAAVTAMLGHRMTEVDVTVQDGTTPVLELSDLRLHSGAAPINLEARDGEVVALVGLLGSGKSRLAEILFGMAGPAAGTMRISGAAYSPRSVEDAIAQGVFLSPKDRGTNAVVPDFGIADNMTLPFLKSLSVGSFLDARRQRGRTQAMVDQLGIVCQTVTDSIGTLSGGNQQKVMIARWLLEQAKVLLLDEPFQGVDIGARRDIGRHIRATAQGRATLVFLAEIDEALEIADRIVVLHENAIVGEHRNQNIDLAALVADISGSDIPTTGAQP
ncbi:sugar ABC transporter ATP-binding protein [Marivita hallyeonensis]|uniref:Monosaccharide ABC transporter ATP-binding protein, CUT2 family n=1 Tax=Marivita hallyeonensis TaxID=996342 RepID=A0A1M5SEK4_9RHOB|nr:sugar ABC transporter ATP-binding protein [Marivita hallyeonensis]SHH36984.1 monosaccharide ABC transporter ATP-binding protein, CUT2 family [Marivita hallyeonensis]